MVNTLNKGKEQFKTVIQWCSKLINISSLQTPMTRCFYFIYYILYSIYFIYYISLNLFWDQNIEITEIHSYQIKHNE